MIDCPKIMALVGDWNGCTFWRVWRPFERLAELGCATAIADKDEPGPESVVHLFDAVILPRMSWEDHAAAEHFIGTLHRAGIAVIYEVDDDLFSENVNTRIQQTVEREASIEVLEQRRLDRLAALRLCDGVTVSSPRLATVMRSIVDCPVLLVPNAIDLTWWQAQLARASRTVPGLTIGWAGGSRPNVDITPMAQAWGRIAERFHQVTFVVYGYQPEAIREYVPADRIAEIPWRPVLDYAAPFVNIDIGCATVADQPFNRSKTPIKAWEYAAAGAAVVATPTLYGNCIEASIGRGHTVETADEWERELTELITFPPRRKNIARKQLRHVRDVHSLRANLHRWPVAWWSIIDSFRERLRAESNRIVIARS